MTDEAADAVARQALERLGAGMRARDPALAGRFAVDALLVGSDPGEIARGRAAIAVLLGALHARPYTIHWDWRTIEATAAGGTLWLFAEGDAVAGDRRLPYRLSGVLRRQDGDWLWALFHGSEPAAG